MQDGDWTTVDTRKKRQDIRQPEARAAAAVSASPKGRVDPLKAIDAAWRQQSAAKQEETTLLQAQQQASTAGGLDEQRFDTPQTDAAPPAKQPAKAKQKPPKVKRARVQSPELPHLEADTIELLLQQLEQKYPGDDSIQLQALVDHLLITFRNCAQVPHDKVRIIGCTIY